MGISRDSALTDDTDLVDILGEQSITNLSETGNWTPLHTAAVNALHRKMLPRLDPSKVSNQNDWKEWLVCWVAHEIFRTEALNANDDVLWAKAEYYAGRLKELWDETLAATEADLDSDGTADRRMGKGLPVVINRKDKSRKNPWGIF